MKYLDWLYILCSAAIKQMVITIYINRLACFLLFLLKTAEMTVTLKIRWLPQNIDTEKNISLED